MVGKKFHPVMKGIGRTGSETVKIAIRKLISGV